MSQDEREGGSVLGCRPLRRGHNGWRCSQLATLSLLTILAARSGRIANADLALETETARVLPRGKWEAGAAFEFQKARDGRELAFPAFVEVGLCNRLELLFEPTFYTAILPNEGNDATGIGDTEVTLTWLARGETRRIPAFALAGEIKFPTATQPQIGTGQADFSGYLIASKQIGKCDVHLNVGYTIAGQSSGATISNYWNFAAAVEYHLSPKFDLLAEILANTSSITGTGTGGESVTNPEATGGEVVGTLGVRYHVNEHAAVFLDLLYDSQNAVGVRTGFSWKF